MAAIFFQFSLSIFQDIYKCFLKNSIVFFFISSLLRIYSSLKSSSVFTRSGSSQQVFQVRCFLIYSSHTGSVWSAKMKLLLPPQSDQCLWLLWASFWKPCDPWSSSSAHSLFQKNHGQPGHLFSASSGFCSYSFSISFHLPGGNEPILPCSNIHWRGHRKFFQFKSKFYIGSTSDWNPDKS